MCGRFVIAEAADEMARLFEAVPANDLPDVPNYNVCPTNRVHVVVSGENGRRLVAMRWGFLPRWYKALNGGPLLINARAETIAEKPAFKTAVRERRCLIPVSGFYESNQNAEGKRLPWYIHPADGGLAALAGVWQDWKQGDEVQTTCAIVTTGANAAMSAIHLRMPISIAPEDWALWLGEAGKGAARLLRPAPDDLFVAHRVDTRVNSNRAVGADLVTPIAA